MKSGKILLAVGLLVVLAAGAYLYLHRQNPSAGGQLAVYYTKVDGTSLGTWKVSQRPQQTGESASEHLHNVALYAAVAALAGPPADVQAIRFPAGTRVLGVSVTSPIVTVDLSHEVAAQSGGSFGENGEFKGLVYTLTGLPGISAVQITVEGRKLQTLPGGHLELDTPLHRSDW